MIAEFLASKGILHCFGIIGAGNARIWDQVSTLGKTKIICVHHEQAAAQAAQTYWRTTGTLAPVLCTTGAGSSNAITGVLSAWMDSVPLLVLSGNEPLRHCGSSQRCWGIQGFPSVEMVRHITKYAARASGQATLHKALNDAYRIALEPRFGPVWVDVPQDVQVAAPHPC